MSGDQYTSAGLHGREERGRRARQPGHAALDRPALRLGRPRRARRQALRRGRPTCKALENGGLRVTTTLDANLQKIAEKWVQAAAIVPHAKNPTAAAKALGFKKLEPWMANLRNKDLHNGALVALDYQTGELVAYVGSANYYATSTKPEFQPQYDVVGKGFRQPGSAFKPFNYATGIDDHKITAGTMLMDVGTDFGGDYTPSDADNLERGPVRVRNALQFSLNIPSVKAMGDQRPRPRLRQGQGLRDELPGRARRPGSPLALGVQEVRPVDLVTAYGTLANGGKEIGHTTILTVKDTQRQGRRAEPYVPPAGKQVGQPAGGLHRHRHPGRQHQPERQPVLGQVRDRRPGRSPAGDPQDRHEQRRQGPQRLRLHRAADGRRPRRRRVRPRGRRLERQLATTAWSRPPGAPLFSIDVSTYVWQGFLNEASAKWPVTNFQQPADGLVRVKIDPWTGLKVDVRHEPSTSGSSSAPSRRTRSAPDTCGIDVVARGQRRDELRQLDDRRPRLAPPRRDAAPGVVGGPDRTRTAYFYNGAFRPVRRLVGRARPAASCGQPSPAPSCYLVPDPGSERRRPVVRDPDADRVRPGRGPLPAGESVRVAVGRAVARTVRATERAATDRAAADGDARADADPERRSRRRPPRSRHRHRPSADGRPDPVDRRRRLSSRVRGLQVRRAGRTILGPLDWTVRAGERWVVLGPNGSGKTTLLSVVGPRRCGRRPARSRSSARATARIDSRELRKRIGTAGSAVEASLRGDLTPVDLVMTARHAATEPWWHVYDEDDRARARGLLERLGLGAGRRSRRTGRCRPASAGGRRSPGR